MEDVEADIGEATMAFEVVMEMKGMDVVEGKSSQQQQSGDYYSTCIP
jgi:hypothetical protein